MTTDTAPAAAGEGDWEITLPAPHQLRRAVLRGNLRIAFSAAAGLTAACLGIYGLVDSYTNWGGRVHHFTQVVGFGWSVAHPDYTNSVPDGVVKAGFPIDRGAAEVGGSWLTARLLPASHQITATGYGGQSPPWISQNILGHVTLPVLLGFHTGDSLSEALGFVGLHQFPGADVKAQQHTYVTGLPKDITASAIVEFSPPLTTAEFASLHARLLSDPYSAEAISTNLTILVSDARPSTAADPGPPLAWPFPDIAGFQHWVAELHGSDQSNLTALGLPHLSLLRAAAQEGQVHGIVVGGIRRAMLLDLLADLRTSSVQVGAVTFAPPPLA